VTLLTKQSSYKGSSELPMNHLIAKILNINVKYVTVMFTKKLSIAVNVTDVAMNLIIIATGSTIV